MCTGQPTESTQKLWWHTGGNTHTCMWSGAFLSCPTRANAKHPPQKRGQSGLRSLPQQLSGHRHTHTHCNGYTRVYTGDAESKSKEPHMSDNCYMMTYFGKASNKKKITHRETTGTFEHQAERQRPSEGNIKKTTPNAASSTRTTGTANRDTTANAVTLDSTRQDTQVR